MTKGVIYRYKYKIGALLGFLMLFSLCIRFIGSSGDYYVNVPQKNNEILIGVNKDFLRRQNELRAEIRRDKEDKEEDAHEVNKPNILEEILENVDTNNEQKEDKTEKISENNQAIDNVEKTKVLKPTKFENQAGDSAGYPNQNKNKNPLPDVYNNWPKNNQFQNNQFQNNQFQNPNDPFIQINGQPQPAGNNKMNISFLANLERIVHIDLKGAPPKPSYFKSFIPMLKKFGATGILIEYEDTFPFEGQLAEARYGFAYTKEDIEMIKSLAKENGLKLIPLVQTYGHLEWLLKLKKFAHLREDSQYPQVITPCLEESYTVLYDMLDQVIKAHNDAEYFHIGCDEVYYKLSHPNCSTYPHKPFQNAFLHHLQKISNYIHSKIPNVKIMFWDDMLHSMDERTIFTYLKNSTQVPIEPMMWGYMENVETYFQQHIYEKYGRIFGSIWIATAYKGASGELATVTSIEHHYRNHISWIEVMHQKISRHILEFKGVALTGWSRYDHFLQLCDILPQAVPSLVVCLQAIQFGELNNDRRNEISRELGCTGMMPWNGEVAYISTSCTFPGHEVYEAILGLRSALNEYQRAMDFTALYMSPLSLNYNYIHKKRASECVMELSRAYNAMIQFQNKFVKACDNMYNNDTAVEWLEVYFTPQFDKLYSTLVTIKKLTAQTNDWKPRPLPVQLKQYPNPNNF